MSINEDKNEKGAKSDFLKPKTQSCLQGEAKGQCGYLYDGTFEGFLCCIFTAFEKKEMPLEMRADDFTLLPTVKIITNPQKAKRLLNGIKLKIGTLAENNIKRVYLSSFENKGIVALKYLQTAFKKGKYTDNMLHLDEVRQFLEIVSKVGKEKMRFVEFIRFSDNNGVLSATIEPEHNILPLIAEHFIDRFPNENFLIYDKVRSLALIYDKVKPQIWEEVEFDEIKPTKEELKYRNLWRLFYDTIEIKERHSDKRRMGLMPKKYWKNMTEFLKE